MTSASGSVILSNRFGLVQTNHLYEEISRLHTRCRECEILQYIDGSLLGGATDFLSSSVYEMTTVPTDNVLRCVAPWCSG